ncbi:MAG: 3-deoxy-manno-octulosonate cytidylyltransferase [Planctomycetes bacterium]|nr:3-deoxy-manno-octulosonate cytidylyltransferase [Planctomycetota bacterium]
MNERAAVVIPARYGSQRLPGKPLLRAGGRTIIEHVWQAVRRCKEVSEIVVATDDQRILATVQDFGGVAVMTSATARTGTDRIGELLPRLNADIIVNVQGDEPDMGPELVDTLIRALRSNPELGVATAAAPWPTGQSVSDPNRVKVVCAANGRALYFSRAAIPHSKTGPVEGGGWPLLHIGVYAYRRAALERFLALPESELERIEALEQLRLLENGIAVHVTQASKSPHGIDTEADFKAFEERLRGNGPVQGRS